MELIPAVDVLDGKVVRLLRGDYSRVTEYGSDPVAAARKWLEEGAERVHVVDLEGAREGDPDYSLWEALGTAGVPFQAGGESGLPRSPSGCSPRSAAGGDGHGRCGIRNGWQVSGSAAWLRWTYGATRRRAPGGSTRDVRWSRCSMASPKQACLDSS